MKIKDDVRRLYQVHKETINPAHPFAKFSVGDLTTLDDRDDTSIRDELIDFYRTHYSADLMSLVLLGPQSLDELESYTTTFFLPTFQIQTQPSRQLPSRWLPPTKQQNSSALSL